MVHLKILIGILLAHLVHASLIESFQALQRHNPSDKYSHCIGISCRDGVLLAAVEPPIVTHQRWLVQRRKCFYKIDGSTFALCGITADIEYIVRFARQVQTKYKQSNNEAIPGDALSEKLAAKLYSLSSHPDTRSMALTVIVCSEKSRIFLVKANGDMKAYKACVTLASPPEAMVSFLKSKDWATCNCDEAMQTLQDFYHKNSSMVEFSRHSIVFTTVGSSPDNSC